MYKCCEYCYSIHQTIVLCPCCDLQESKKDAKQVGHKTRATCMYLYSEALSLDQEFKAELAAYLPNAQISNSILVIVFLFHFIFVKN
jgi:hypothetical protein